MKTVPCRSEPLFGNGAQSSGPDGVKEGGVSREARFRNVGNVGDGGLICNGRSGAVLLSSTLFPKATVFGEMHSPAHMVDAPVPGLAIDFLGLRFTSLGRDTHPGLVRLLLFLVRSVLLVLLLRSAAIFLILILLGTSIVSISRTVLVLAAFSFILELLSQLEICTTHLLDLGTESNDGFCLLR